MTSPNINKDQNVKWIPLTSAPQSVPSPQTKSIDELINKQIKKKMKTLLQPINNEEDER
jgi:uncharacterized membrane protein YvbJ